MSERLLSLSIDILCPYIGGWDQQHNEIEDHEVRATEIKGMWMRWNRILFNTIRLINSKSLCPYDYIDKYFSDVFGSTRKKSLIRIVTEYNSKLSHYYHNFTIELYLERELKDETKKKLDFALFSLLAFLILGAIGRRNGTGKGSTFIRSVNVYYDLDGMEVKGILEELKNEDYSYKTVLKFVRSYDLEEECHDVRDRYVLILDTQNIFLCEVHNLKLENEVCQKTPRNLEGYRDARVLVLSNLPLEFQRARKESPLKYKIVSSSKVLAYIFDIYKTSNRNSILSGKNNTIDKLRYLGCTKIDEIT